MKLIDEDALADLMRDTDPAHVAELFAEMDGEEQVQFFNKLAIIGISWGCLRLESQLHRVGESATLTQEGRDLMVMIGEYAGSKTGA